MKKVIIIAAALYAVQLFAGMEIGQVGVEAQQAAASQTECTLQSLGL